MTTRPHAVNSIRLLLVDGHDGVRDGLTRSLGDHPDIDVVGAVGNVKAAIEAATGLVPDVAVIDVQLTDGNGLTLCQRLGTISPTTRCIIHTSTELTPGAASDAGAVSVVLKQLTGDGLLRSIRAAARPPTETDD